MAAPQLFADLSRKLPAQEVSRLALELADEISDCPFGMRHDHQMHVVVLTAEIEQLALHLLAGLPKKLFEPTQHLVREYVSSVLRNEDKMYMVLVYTGSTRSPRVLFFHFAPRTRRHCWTAVLYHGPWQRKAT